MAKEVRIPMRSAGLALITIAGWLLVAGAPGAGRADEPDYTALRINEVIADNGSTAPLDAGDGTPDMVEIFNAGTETVALGSAAGPEGSLALSDTYALPPADSLYTFRDGLEIPPSRSIVVFCDGNACQDECEPHASFQIDNGGKEPITLWGPVVGKDAQGDPVREIVDQVWLPPLRADVSFGRSPDGAGPAPVPLDDVLDTFVFFPAAHSSFGTCLRLAAPCCASQALRKQFCRGARNAAGANLEPRVSRVSHSTNAPEEGEPVEFVVAVRDDQEPTPPGIARVEILYRVDGGPEQSASMEYDDLEGVLPRIPEGARPGDPEFPAAPLDRHTLWHGSIPGQPAGAVVDFRFEVEDSGGLMSSRPRNPCPEGVGPCSRGFGGPGCTPDPASVSCRNPDYDPATDPPEAEYRLHGVRFFDCDAPFRYTVGYEPRPAVRGLVVSEVLAAQTAVLRDATSADPDICAGDDAPKYCCRTPPGQDPDPTCGFEDVVEIHNASGAAVDLSGIYLSDSFFHPRGWKFPEGAAVGAGERILVWLDDDGAKCPDPDRPLAERPCFWECPDPNGVVPGEFHANFAIDADSDQIFLYDTDANRCGRIHGVAWPLEDGTVPLANRSLMLLPDGSPRGCFVLSDPVPEESDPPPADVFPPTLGKVNEGEPCLLPPSFRRGDANADCRVDISDGVAILNWLFLGATAPTCRDAADSDDSGSVDLTDAIRIFNFLFLGGAAPPSPGPSARGEDPTGDALPECVYNDSCF